MKTFAIHIDNTHLYLETSEGKTYVHNLSEFPVLACATKVQRDNFSLSPFGVHWPDIDEDLSFEGLISTGHLVIKTA